jgi:ribosome-binding factor A
MIETENLTLPPEVIAELLQSNLRFNSTSHAWLTALTTAHGYTADNLPKDISWRQLLASIRYHLDNAIVDESEIDPNYNLFEFKYS